MLPPRPEAPVRQFLLKVSSRCDLACDHCYVYRHADQSWRHQPRFMARAVLEQAIFRIAEHAAKHDLPRVFVVLHGGEPLLAGPRRLEQIAAAIRQQLTPIARVTLGLQTNALLLDEAFLDVFDRHRVHLGVSLDGPALAHDRHRRRADGRGSHADVEQSLSRLLEPRYRHLFNGFLCTVDLANDPLTVYEHLIGFEPPEIDFLLPLATHATPPPGREPGSSTAPYAEWLITIFDRWFDAPALETRVRLFESIISLLLGGPSGSEVVGLDSIDLATIETDGAIQLVDSLKVAGPGQPATGLHVATHSFDEYLEHPGVRARQSGIAALSRVCQECALVTICGGGLYPTRYHPINGFQSPSVYCPDLAGLIRHIAGRLAQDLDRLRSSDMPPPEMDRTWTVDR